MVTLVETPVETPVETLPVAPRLSEALRYGQMNTEQGFGRFVDSRGRMCALGTIWHGMGYNVTNEGVGKFVLDHPEWGFLLDEIDTRPLLAGICIEPCPRGKARTLADCVIHLNDDHHMPRNEIADRLSQFGL